MLVFVWDGVTLLFAILLVILLVILNGRDCDRKKNPVGDGGSGAIEDRKKSSRILSVVLGSASQNLLGIFGRYLLVRGFGADCCPIKLSNKKVVQ
jgi:hypothetical protein